MKITKGFGERIRSLRKAHRLSAANLASALKVSNVAIYKYETEEAKPSETSFEKLADLLQTSAEYLSSGEVVDENISLRRRDNVDVAYDLCRRFLDEEKDLNDLEKLLLDFVSERVKKKIRK